MPVVDRASEFREAAFVLKLAVSVKVILARGAASRGVSRCTESGILKEEKHHVVAPQGAQPGCAQRLYDHGYSNTFFAFLASSATIANSTRSPSSPVTYIASRFTP